MTLSLGRNRVRRNFRVGIRLFYLSLPKRRKFRGANAVVSAVVSLRRGLLKSPIALLLLRSERCMHAVVGTFPGENNAGGGRGGVEGGRKVRVNRAYEMFLNSVE